MEDIEKYYQWDREYTWYPWAPNIPKKDENLFLIKGEGCYVTGVDGKTYLDATSAALNASCGYNHPQIIKKITQQLAQIMHFDFRQSSTIPTVELAKKMSDLLPDKLTRTFFCNSGSEAIETAVKIVGGYFKFSGKAEKNQILSLENGYHGTTLGAASISQSEFVQSSIQPLPEGFHKVNFNTCTNRNEGPLQPQVELLEEKILEIGPDNVAAFFVEPEIGRAHV